MVVFIYCLGLAVVRKQGQSREGRRQDGGHFPRGNLEVVKRNFTNAATFFADTHKHTDTLTLASETCIMRACTGFWFGVEDELGCSSLPVTENGIAPRVVKVSHVLCGLKRRQNGWTLGWPGYQERPGRAARDQSEKHFKLNRFGRVWMCRRRNLLVASVMNRDVAANLMASLRFQ